MLYDEKIVVSTQEDIVKIWSYNELLDVFCGWITIPVNDDLVTLQQTSVPLLQGVDYNLYLEIWVWYLQFKWNNYKTYENLILNIVWWNL